MIFVANYVSAMVFRGGILGSARKIWSNPYLNSMTVLFDIYYDVHYDGWIMMRVYNKQCNYFVLLEHIPVGKIL